MLKSASRARSEVGRTVSPGGAAMRRPRCLPATIRMSSHGLDTQLLAEHPPRHLLDRAAREMTELEGTVGHPDEARHIEPQMCEHAADLPVLALLQRDREPGVAALLALELGADRAIGNGLERDALLQGLELCPVHRTVHAHTVPPDPAARRQLQCPREPAVVGEQQEAFRREVETPD